MHKQFELYFLKFLKIMNENYETIRDLSDIYNSLLILNSSKIKAKIKFIKFIL